MAFKDNVRAVVAQRYDASAATGGYEIFNTGGLSHACFYVKIVNDSNAPIEISYDGANTHDVVRSDSDAVLNLQTNSRLDNSVAYMPKGTLLHILIDLKYNPTGYVYLIGYYQQ